jgi:isoleucyl-tRNA synthetase
VTVSDEIFKRTSDTYRRIRNTARFLLANLHGFDPMNEIGRAPLAPTRVFVGAADVGANGVRPLSPLTPTVAIDCWIVERARLLQEEIKAAYDSYQFHLIYQKIHNFCSIELGSFYLDIIKDRQYTLPTHSIARRSAQTAMYHIAEALVRWLAPILSFTAEELWTYLPGKRESSVFLSAWYDQFPIQEKLNPSLSEWDLIIEVRNIVNKELEKQRSEGQIGSPLEAEVCLFCTPDSKIASVLKSLEDELRFVLITSSASLCEQAIPEEEIVEETLSNGERVGIQIHASSDPKCARCWHRRPVSIVPDYPDICERCVINITTDTGEKRYYA